MHSARVRLLAHSLILAGVILIALWPLHPAVISWGYNASGVRMLRAAPQQPPEALYAQAARAGQAFQTALAWDPLNARAYANLAEVYLTWGDAASAARALSRAVALDPRDATLWLRLGHAFRATGQIDAASDAYTRALTLQPNNSAASQALESLKATTP